MTGTWLTMLMVVLLRYSGSCPHMMYWLWPKSLVSAPHKGLFPIRISYRLHIISVVSMGNMCCQGTHERNSVTRLANSLPSEPRYCLVANDSVRFSEVSVRKSERNIYIFSMCIKDEVDIHADVAVLKEIVHCIMCENYELKVGSRAVVDIFCKKYTSGLLEVTSKSDMAFSMKVIPFKSYTSSSFKKALYEKWINEKMGIRSNATVKLLDSFIYGLNPEQQAFVFLFERCPTSLANVAEYRKEANMPWNDKEKMKVIAEVLESYEAIHNKNIVHRDIRPSNVFYCSTSGRFNIGNFSSSRLIRRNQENDLMTVCGVPYYSCNDVQALMGNNESIGYYEGLEQDYFGLKSVINIIETCDLLDQNPTKPSPEVARILTMLSERKDFNLIMAEVNNMLGKKSIDRDSQIGDKEIADSCGFLLAHTHRELIEQWCFQTYGLLGYNKEFSTKAHRILDLNNEKDKQLENAPILRKLGEFYESKGSKGTEYFYNSFVLYIARAERQLKYGYPDKADQELDAARETYLKFNKDMVSEMPRIEINRISALLESERGNDNEASKIMEETYVKAGEQNIPVEGQCKVLLAFGQVSKYRPEARKEAIKKLYIGETICEHGTSFQSPSSCRIYKSDFYYEIGSLYLQDILESHNPKKHADQQRYGNDVRARAEVNLRSSLEIREKEAVDQIDVANCLEQLGTLCYHDEKFYDAQKYYERTLIRLNHLDGEVNPIKQVKALYMKGSSSYYLSSYAEAKRDYETALQMTSRLESSKHNTLLAYNIEGNLGLAMIQLHEPEGKTVFNEAVEKIKDMEGERSYDYACLMMAYRKISRN